VWRFLNARLLVKECRQHDRNGCSTAITCVIHLQINRLHLKNTLKRVRTWELWHRVLGDFKLPDYWGLSVGWRTKTAVAQEPPSQSASGKFPYIEQHFMLPYVTKNLGLHEHLGVH
jgi:hypothetical protein